MAIQWNSHPHLVLLLLFLLFFLLFLLSLSCLQLIDSFLKLLQPYFPRCEICEMLLWCLQKLGIHKMVPFISVGHWSPHFWMKHSWGIHPPNKMALWLHKTFELPLTSSRPSLPWNAACTCNLLGVVFAIPRFLTCSWNFNELLIDPSAWEARTPWLSHRPRPTSAYQSSWSEVEFLGASSSFSSEAIQGLIMDWTRELCGMNTGNSWTHEIYISI